MKYFIIAGEASGDLHASHLIAALRQVDPQAQFVFFGGDMMAAAAGTAPVVHYSQMAYMGFVDVVRNLGKVRRNLAIAQRVLRDERPDVFVAVDYPSFNLRICKAAHALGIRTCWYISPKVWAWKEWRVRTLRRVVDRMLCILPFEPKYYHDRHNWDVQYVGNPSVAEIDAALAQRPSEAEFRRSHRLPSRQLIALLPGSRVGEIKNNLRVMLQAADGFVQYRPVIAGAPGIAPELYQTIAPGIPVVYNDTLTLLSYSRAALVTSGTATLEAALAGTPQVACYRSNGSKLAYRIMQKLLKVNYVTLPNLIADAPVIPELLLHLCTPQAVAEALSPLTNLNSDARQAMLEGYAEVRRRLGTEDAALTAARAIVAP